MDKLDDFKRGWLVGDFEPALVRTDVVEIGVQTYQKGYVPELHYQRIAVEHNLVITGSIRSNGKVYTAGQIFTFLPYEICECEFLEDTTLLCIKTPSIPDDKILCK